MYESCKWLNATKNYFRVSEDVFLKWNSENTLRHSHKGESLLENKNLLTVEREVFRENTEISYPRALRLEGRRLQLIKKQRSRIIFFEMKTSGKSFTRWYNFVCNQRHDMKIFIVINHRLKYFSWKETTLRRIYFQWLSSKTILEVYIIVLC